MQTKRPRENWKINANDEEILRSRETRIRKDGRGGDGTRGRAEGKLGGASRAEHWRKRTEGYRRMQRRRQCQPKPSRQADE